MTDEQKVYRLSTFRKSVATLCAGTFLLQSSAALAAEVTTYNYDEARADTANVGKLTTVTNGAAKIQYDHDANGNVIAQTWVIDGETYTQRFTYAKHGQLLSKTFADGKAFPAAGETFQYDAYGNLKSVPGLITAISRNAAFDPVATTYANGVTETRTYDPNRQWLMSISTKSGANTLFEESYVRNDKGLITDVASNRPNSDWTYGYDTANRLTSATNLENADYTQTFQYDAADNVTFNSAIGSYTYPAPTAPRPHAVKNAGSKSYSYDLNGNMVSGDGRTIVYDGEDRPVSVTVAGRTTSFVYGPDGARLKKTTDGETTLYLGADEEITPEGTHIKHPLDDVRIAGAEINWMHRDHLSSVKLMSDATGVVIAENLYRPYGERSDVQVTAGAPRESKGWIGERDDPETGLTYLNARYYDPVLARFISPDWFDPKRKGVGTNRFAYAGNNPIAQKDPSGNLFLGSTEILAAGWESFKDFLASCTCKHGERGKGDNGGPQFTPEEEAQHKTPPEPPNDPGIVPATALAVGNMGKLGSSDKTAYSDADLQGAADSIHSKLTGPALSHRVTTVTQTPDGRIIVSTTGGIPNPAQRLEASRIFGSKVEFVTGGSTANAPGDTGHHAEQRGMHYLGDSAAGSTQASSHYACEGCSTAQAGAAIKNVTGNASDHGGVYKRLLDPDKAPK